MSPARPYPNLLHSVLLCVSFVVAQSVLAVPLALSDELLKSRLLQHPLGLGAVNLLAFGATLAMVRWIGRLRWDEIFVPGPVRAAWVAGALLSVVGAIIVLSEVDNLVRVVLPMPEAIARIFRQLADGRHPAWQMLFLLSIVAPVTEEILCRGVILRGLLWRMRVRKAILISAVLFGALHLNPWQFISAGSLGVLFGWWYARTGSLLLCLGGHALVNAMVWGNPYLPFQIQGFSVPETTTVTRFQPLWFDALGLALLGAGLWLFHRTAPRLWPAPPVLLPPVLPPALPGPHTPAASEPVPRATAFPGNAPTTGDQAGVTVGGPCPDRGAGA